MFLNRLPCGIDLFISLNTTYFTLCPRLWYSARCCGGCSSSCRCRSEGLMKKHSTIWGGVPRGFWSMIHTVSQTRWEWALRPSGARWRRRTGTSLSEWCKYSSSPSPATCSHLAFPKLSGTVSSRTAASPWRYIPLASPGSQGGWWSSLPKKYVPKDLQDPHPTLFL